MFNFKWPFTNQYTLNLDWLLSVVKDMCEKVDKVKDAYSPEQPPPYPVTSVEGQTGDVQIDFPVESVNGKTGAVVTPFTGYGMEPLKMFDADSNAQYYGFNRRLADGKTLECWIKEDGHLSLVLRAADGQELGNWQTVNNAEIPSSEVLSVNGKSGIVVLNAGDVGAVPTTRTINGKPLSASVTLNASDVSAVPTNRTVNGKSLADNVSLNASDVNAVPTTRTINGKALSSNVTLYASDVEAVPAERTVNGFPLTDDVTLTPVNLGIVDTLFGGNVVLTIGQTFQIDKPIEYNTRYIVQNQYGVGVASVATIDGKPGLFVTTYQYDRVINTVTYEAVSDDMMTLQVAHAQKVTINTNNTLSVTTPANVRLTSIVKTCF